jgi:hypothetical protein
LTWAPCCDEIHTWVRICYQKITRSVVSNLHWFNHWGCSIFCSIKTVLGNSAERLYRQQNFLLLEIVF